MSRATDGATNDKNISVVDWKKLTEAFQSPGTVVVPSIQVFGEVDTFDPKNYALKIYTDQFATPANYTVSYTNSDSIPPKTPSVAVPKRKVYYLSHDLYEKIQYSSGEGFPEGCDPETSYFCVQNKQPKLMEWVEGYGWQYTKDPYSGWLTADNYGEPILGLPPKRKVVWLSTPGLPTWSKNLPYDPEEYYFLTSSHVELLQAIVQDEGRLFWRYALDPITGKRQTPESYCEEEELKEILLQKTKANAVSQGFKVSSGPCAGCGKTLDYCCPACGSCVECCMHNSNCVTCQVTFSHRQPKEDACEHCERCKAHCKCCPSCGSSLHLKCDEENGGTGCGECVKCCSCTERCPSCLNAFSDEEDEPHSHCECGGSCCAKCCCGYNKNNAGKSKVAPWEERGIVVSPEGMENEERAHKVWGFKPSSFNPVEAFCSFYTLIAIVDRLGLPAGEWDGRTLDILTDAEQMLDALMKEADGQLTGYMRMCLWGEIRYHKALGKPSRLSTGRGNAWVRGKILEEKVGPECYRDLAVLFREMTDRSIGGEKWAVAADLLYQRLSGQINDARTWIDRIMTLCHNGGSLFNKVMWQNGNEYITESGHFTRYFSVESIRNIFGPIQASERPFWPLLIWMSDESTRNLWWRWEKARNRERLTWNLPPLMSYRSWVTKIADHNDLQSWWPRLWDSFKKDEDAWNRKTKRTAPPKREWVEPEPDWEWEDRMRMEAIFASVTHSPQAKAAKLKEKWAQEEAEAKAKATKNEQRKALAYKEAIAALYDDEEGGDDVTTRKVDDGRATGAEQVEVYLWEPRSSEPRFDYV